MLLDLYLGGDLTKEEYRTRKEEYAKNIKALEKRIRELEKKKDTTKQVTNKKDTEKDNGKEDKKDTSKESKKETKKNKANDFNKLASDGWTDLTRLAYTSHNPQVIEDLINNR